jgi:O-antigen/teichoic acid export membrane protein
LYYKADVLILSGARPDADVGMYAAAYKLVDIAQALVLAAIIAAYPRLARAAAARTGSERWAGTRVSELALLIIAPSAAVAFLLRNDILALLYGDGYPGAAAPAAFLVLALVPLALNLLGGYILAAADRMKVMAALYAAAGAVKLTAVALVAPRWGGEGVAAAMFGSEMLLGLGILLALRRTAHVAPGPRALAGVLAAAAACLIVSLLPGVSPLLRAALFLTLIAAAYAWLDLVPAEERTVLRAALRRRSTPRAVQP